MTSPAPFPPTALQLQALRFIAAFQLESGGVSPTLREIAFALGLGPGNSAARRRLDGLVERGLVRRLSRRARAIELLPGALRFVHPPASRAPDGAPLFFVPAPRPPEPECLPWLKPPMPKRPMIACAC